MGCSQSVQVSVQKQNQANNSKQKQNLMLVLGSTQKQNLIIGFQTNGKLQIQKYQYTFPKYSNAFMYNQSIGYITGGVDQVELNAKSTIDEQIIEGIVSKKIYKINLQKILIDPSKSFEEMSDMINPRYAHTVIQMNDKLYVLGGRHYGDDENGMLTACQSYDMKINKWKSLPPLQNARSGAVCIIYSKKIYIFGGYTGNNIRSRTIETYGEGNSSWKKLPFQLHEGFQGLAIIKNPLQKNSILIFGGKNNDGRSDQVVSINWCNNSLIRYNSMLQGRSFHKIFTIDNDVYLIGGNAESIELYNIQKQTSRIDEELSYFQYCTMKQLNYFVQFKPKIEIQSSSQSQSVQYKHAKHEMIILGHAYEPFCKVIDLTTKHIHSESQNLMHNFYQFTTVVKVNKEHSFILGGISSNLTHVTNAVYSYNYNTQQVVYLKPMINPRYAFSAVVKGGFLYVIGGRKLGKDDIAIMNQCQRYSFETYQWQAITSLKHQRQSSTAIVIKNFLIVIGGYQSTGLRTDSIQIFSQDQRRWIQLEQKFDLAIEMMTSVEHLNSIYLFGGRTNQHDSSRIFKLHLHNNEKSSPSKNHKKQQTIKLQLELIGELSKSGTNLKVYFTQAHIAYIVGHVQYGIDKFNLKNYEVQSSKISALQQLEDGLLYCYTIIF